MEQSVTVARAFERESHRIDQLIWDAMALRAGESVLFCGFANNLEWIKRAAGVGVAVSVISDDSEAIREARSLPVTVLRGSTSILPARDLAYDATVAFHYLHEIDPLFHANVVSEIARVGKRCVIVEPAPPSDPLGLRIASLYSRAKRGLGQFENYHHLDYWRKLLALVKFDVSCQTFTFLRHPPAQAVHDTVSLIIDTMEAEETPKQYLAELRALAARDDAQLVPQARYVLVGTSLGQVVRGSGAGTDFRDTPLEEARAAVIARPFVPPNLTGARPPALPPRTPTEPTVYTAAEIEPEFPAVLPPAAAMRETPAPLPPAALSQVARNAFGLATPPLAKPTPEAKPNLTERVTPLPDVDEDDFGVPDVPAAEMPAEFGWSWEPPEGSTES